MYVASWVPWMSGLSPVTCVQGNWGGTDSLCIGREISTQLATVAASYVGAAPPRKIVWDTFGNYWDQTIHDARTVYFNNKHYKKGFKGGRY